MRMRILILAGACASLAAPATVMASHGGPHPNNGQGTPGMHHHGVTGPTGGSGATGTTGATGLGVLCQKESKHHIPGQQGTPFSQCVTALAHLHSGKADNPAEACKGLSHRHVQGMHGTPFSRCVAAAAKLTHTGPTVATGSTGATGPTGATGATG